MSYPETEERIYPNPDDWKIVADGRDFHEDMESGVVVLRPRKRRPVRKITSSRDVHKLVSDAGYLDREALYGIYLGPAGKVLGIYVMALGGQTAAVVEPGILLRTGLVLGAKEVVMCHNHPSGQPEPSAEDVALTERCQRLGAAVGLPIADHVIVAGDGYFSFLDARMLLKELR